MLANSHLSHDEAVRRAALILAATGYRVQARVEGWFDLPEFINGYRPDIIARSGDHFFIFEVKKGEIDWPKISAFEQFAKTNHAFQLYVFTPKDILEAGGKILFDELK